MIAVASFLDEMTARFSSEFATFEVYQFLGTAGELLTRLAAWARPPEVEVRHIDIGQIILEALNPTAATTAVESALQAVALSQGRLMISMSGLHLLAALYPSGLLQPVNRWLRRGNRVVVVAVHPLHPLRLPDSAYVSDWRPGLATEVGLAHTITHGGV